MRISYIRVLFANACASYLCAMYTCEYVTLLHNVYNKHINYVLADCLQSLFLFVPHSWIG